MPKWCHLHLVGASSGILRLSRRFRQVQQVGRKTSITRLAAAPPSSSFKGNDLLDLKPFLHALDWGVSEVFGSPGPFYTTRQSAVPDGSCLTNKTIRGLDLFLFLLFLHFTTPETLDLFVPFFLFRATRSGNRLPGKETEEESADGADGADATHRSRTPEWSFEFGRRPSKQL